jgi:RNA polymerase sigma-70 factor (ECF subfamily)
MDATQTQRGTTRVTDVEEQQLLTAALGRSEAAWRRLREKYDGLIRHQVGKVIARHRDTVLSSDAVDEILARFYLKLVEHNMRRLRAFDPTRGMRLASWLGFLATREACRFLRTAFRHAAVPIEELDEAEPARGARWVTECP